MTVMETLQKHGAVNIIQHSAGYMFDFEGRHYHARYWANPLSGVIYKDILDVTRITGSDAEKAMIRDVERCAYHGF